MMSRTPGILLALAAASATILAQTSEETLAQRQFLQARNFANQGNYKEALNDYRRVVDTYPTSSVADNALLDMARYYFEIGGDATQASALVEQIKSKYSTSESAPDAYVIAGRITLARSHSPADLEAAFAQFDRVPGLFPDAPSVPAALAFAGEARRLQRRPADALDRFQRVTTDYDTTPAAAAAHLGIGMILATQGDYTGAMEEFQRVRNRWPDSREAAVALGRSTSLFRLYVRAKSGPAYAISPDPIGPLKADNIRSLVTTSRDVVYFASESSVSLLTPANAERPPVAVRPRALGLDAAGSLVVVEGNVLRPQTGPPLTLVIPQPGKTPRPLAKIDAVVATSSGDWLVMDDDEKLIVRFDAAGRLIGPFAAVRFSRMVINEFDEIAGIERDSKNIVVLDPAGKPIARIQPKGAGYEYFNPEDIAFDPFGHVFVLDRTALLVFDYKKLLSPVPATARTPAAAAAAQTANSPIVTIFAEPGAIRRGNAFALDSAGRMYVADDRAQKIQLYR